MPARSGTEMSTMRRMGGSIPSPPRPGAPAGIRCARGGRAPHRGPGRPHADDRPGHRPGLREGLRTCAVADAFADAAALSLPDRRAIHLAALLRSVGCTSHAPENASMFGDDIAFEAALRVLDPGDPERFAAQMRTFGDWAGTERQPALARRFGEVAPAVGPQAAQAGCEVSHPGCRRLNLPPEGALAPAAASERCDGHGIPGGLAGEAISLPGRVVPLAEQAVIAHAAGGPAGAVAEVDRRAGGHLDPALAGLFAAHAEAALAPLDAWDPLAEVLAREP